MTAIPEPGARLGRRLLLAPVIFVAHFLEEAPGFVTWFNARVTPEITTDLFWTVNGGALAITIFAAAGVRATGAAGAALFAAGWLSFLMLANAAFHLTAAIVDRGYVPGLVTALLLYLPHCGWVGRELLWDRRLPVALLAAAAVLGAIPMAVHGYRIVFLGSRLF